jgi:hypothetical protein
MALASPQAGAQQFQAEGNGDFDDTPIVEKTEPASPQASDVPAAPDLVVDIPAATQDDSPAAPTAKGSDSSASGKAQKRAAVKRPSKRTPAQVGAGGLRPGLAAKGLFVVTQRPCELHREPASESPVVGQSKHPRRLWVERVDDSDWFQSKNLRGETVFLNRSCVQTP